MEASHGSGAAGRMGIATAGSVPASEELAHRVDEYVEYIEYIEIGELVDGARGYAAIAERLTATGPAEEGNV